MNINMKYVIRIKKTKTKMYIYIFGLILSQYMHKIHTDRTVKQLLKCYWIFAKNNMQKISSKALQTLQLS